MVADASEDLETRICQPQTDLSAIKTERNPYATPFSIITGEHLRVYPDDEKRVMAEAELLGISYQNPRYWDKVREAIKQGKAEQLKKDEELKYQGCLAPTAACLALEIAAFYGLYRAIEYFF